LRIFGGLARLKKQNWSKRGIVGDDLYYYSGNSLRAATISCGGAGSRERHLTSDAFAAKTLDFPPE
jgi:hypothetical protein